MKNYIILLFSIFLFCLHPIHAKQNKTNFDINKRNARITSELNKGASVKNHQAINSSMLAWGVGLAAIIAVVSVVAQSSTGSSSDTTTN